MAIEWIDVRKVDIDALLLLERVQIAWLFDYLPAEDLAPILAERPYIRRFFERKCPEIGAALGGLGPPAPAAAPCGRDHEERVLRKIADWLVYALDPEAYDRQPFTRWDSAELLGLADFRGKRVVDVGAGTGRLGLTVADRASAVYCVEPVGNLRAFIAEKAGRLGLATVYCTDGLITAIPFEDGFADVVLAGHVFGDEPEREHRELSRVAKRGGSIILCPGNIDADNDIHAFLVAAGFGWSAFDEPGDGRKRKYWKRNGG